MKYFRFGHCKDVFVKKGDKVTKGQKIATVGTGNGQWSAHLHLDVFIKKLASWTAYNFGWTKDETNAVYIDPTPYIKIVLPSFDHYGWRFLEWAKYGLKYCFHPGVDLNGKGAGNADIGDPIYSACDGEVVYCYDDQDKNGGWGKLIVIQEIIKQQENEYLLTEENIKNNTPSDGLVVDAAKEIQSMQESAKPMQTYAPPSELSEVLKEKSPEPVIIPSLIELIKKLINLIFKTNL